MWPKSGKNSLKIILFCLRLDLRLETTWGRKSETVSVQITLLLYQKHPSSWTLVFAQCSMAGEESCMIFNCAITIKNSASRSFDNARVSVRIQTCLAHYISMLDATQAPPLLNTGSRCACFMSGSQTYHARPSATRARPPFSHKQT